ncbi:hypothetical protein [Reyranella sp. CPCC 100927]|uniref:hypothetical protein n=1 Tax=Reyranella sp. CPCC 100927 TaxID=2599616 RepID=UPI0011B59E9C|nr:hypothetical protein [Reyranella sp. CPCC 100927]TWT14906.1 hypothetical protein FQU96_00625 [Reyranella sp. CPCC 100927]
MRKTFFLIATACFALSTSAWAGQTWNGQTWNGQTLNGQSVKSATQSLPATVQVIAVELPTSR